MLDTSNMDDAAFEDLLVIEPEDAEVPRLDV